MQRQTPHIPDHEITRKIGSGAYGEVWLARTITGAWRAVKIVRREDFDDDRSFQREFEGIRHYEPIARNHPGLVHILHVGSSNEPSPFYYYVMELGDDVESGANISQETYRPRTLQTDKKLSIGTPLPVEYVLEIGIQLSGALSYLHSKELTHRDIKPANVIFVNDLPKLADVGLVAQRDQRTFVGTEGFIPHEGPGTKRADVFALGKVLYELATGKDRLDFPELPDSLPEDFDRENWLELNKIICACCEPDLQRCQISSAAKLHNALKDIKKGKKFKNKKSSPFSSPGRLLAALSGIALAFTLMMGGLYLYYKSNTPTPPITQKTATTEGSLIINSQPQGASIYDAQGNMIGETPHGPIRLPVGTEVSYTLKMDGYRNWTEKGVIRADQPLGIGGKLIAYTPPVKGQPWHDSDNQAYSPHEASHLSNAPVSTASIEKFLTQKKQTDRKAASFILSPPNAEKEKSYALITPGDALEYTDWLTERSQKEGLLSENQAITPLPIEEWEGWKLSSDDKENNLSAYLLQAGDVNFVKANITSNPEGALVTLNGVNLGKTPVEWTKLSPGQYSITFKLPGHERYEAKGIVQENKDLNLHVNLIKDGSVEFNKEWKNSMTMEFVPLSPTLSVSKYLTKISEFREYLFDTKSLPSPSPKFAQTPDHPVVNITREEARQFADWLTKKEQQSGLLDISDYYRLPTDREWTAFAGGAPEEGRYPSDRHTALLQPELGAEGTSDLFLWGNTWPPPADAGNFADISAQKVRKDRIIPGYEDKFTFTSPVGTFKPNRLGLYDISGNVWEWVDDDFGGAPGFNFRDYEVARGGSWSTYKQEHLLTRYRYYCAPNTTLEDIGFRLVLVRQPLILEEDTLPSPESSSLPGEEPSPSAQGTSATSQQPKSDGAPD